MDSVHIVTFHNVLHHFTYKVAVLLIGRIEQDLSVVPKKTLRFTVADVILGQNLLSG